MDPIILPIDERLAAAGDTWSLAGHLDEPGYAVGDHEFSLPSGIDYDVVLTNSGEGILATGILRAHAVGTCDRCLEDAEFDVDAEVDGYYLFEEPEQLSDDEDEVDFELVSADRTIDLSGALVSALVMETPFVVLCREDCAGLCPVCGANLNEVDCGCVVEPDPDFERPNPFAVLAGFTFADGTTVADHAKELEELDEAASEGLEDDLDDEEFEAAWEERQKAEGEGPGAGV